jgi:DNA repair exonuclease SbcCD ATPase subunit
VRRELDALRRELEEARHELGHLEVQRAEADRALAHDRIELQQLQHTLLTMRDQAVTANNELVEARESVDDILSQVEAAERARDAITIDAADVLARAEAEATSLLERATRDAEAIRQQAIIDSGADSAHGTTPITGVGSNGVGRFAEETLRSFADQVGGLERQVAKQRKRLDRLTGRGDHGGKAAKGGAGRRNPKRESTAVDLIGAAEREAAEIRRAARREREDFRAELVGLLSRFAPVEDEVDEFED